MESCLPPSNFISFNSFFLPSEIVGINSDGETYLYNGDITKHWVKTQLDTVMITKVRLSETLRRETLTLCSKLTNISHFSVKMSVVFSSNFLRNIL